MLINMWVYLNSETNLFTVGFYHPKGQWHPESDWGTREEASKRVNYLNGGNGLRPYVSL